MHIVKACQQRSLAMDTDIARMALYLDPRYKEGVQQGVHRQLLETHRAG
jgi:hypothetical protein